jgi:hypothetical protein
MVSVQGKDTRLGGGEGGTGTGEQNQRLTLSNLPLSCH